MYIEEKTQTEGARKASIYQYGKTQQEAIKLTISVITSRSYSNLFTISKTGKTEDLFTPYVVMLGNSERTGIPLEIKSNLQSCISLILNMILEGLQTPSFEFKVFNHMQEERGADYPTYWTVSCRIF